MLFHLVNGDSWKVGKNPSAPNSLRIQWYLSGSGVLKLTQQISGLLLRVSVDLNPLEEFSPRFPRTRLSKSDTVHIPNLFDLIAGQYCIYKKGVCPKGLTEGFLLFDDENFKNQNQMGGTLPDGVYNQDTKLFYCCRTDGDKKKPMSLPLVTPFYLMAFNSSECQLVKGALATQEYIQFDDEDELNKDTSNGTHPYEKGKLNVTITYCYYEGECGWGPREEVTRESCVLECEYWSILQEHRPYSYEPGNRDTVDVFILKCRMAICLDPGFNVFQ